MRYKAFAKVNIFLKIVGFRGSYHEILSRFILVENLFDELYFCKKTSNVEFELVGDFGCNLEQNTIFKAYKVLQEEGYEEQLKDIFSKKALRVEKNIPSFAGLGGGSSDAATFLHMVNSEARLGLSSSKLAKISQKVGADVTFFVYGFKSANVSGIGEIVEKFEEQPLHVEIITPKIKCDTGKIYRTFREDYRIDLELADKMSKMTSVELLSRYSDLELNDLLKPAIKVKKELDNYRKKGLFFSGSGSSFFGIGKTDG